MHTLRSLTLLIMMLAVPVHEAVGSGVVGHGLPGTCTEAAFDAALAGGGAVTFDCGGSDTIFVSHTKVITRDTVLVGNDRIALSGQNQVRVLLVTPGASLRIEHLIIAEGYSAAEPGGAIRNLGALTIDHSTIGGSRSDTFGGAVANEGTGIIQASTIVGNVGNTAGGGVANFRTLMVSRSTFFRNATGGPGNGGGIANYGVLTVSNSTFDDNSAWYDSGGIVPGYGGGIVNLATAFVTNSTFFRNNGVGGGIENMGTLTLKNTLIASSTWGDCDEELGGMTTPDSTHNLFGDQSGGCGGSWQPVTADDLRLKGLADNGGPTLTVALLPGSAALGAGDVATCRDTTTVNGLDQRGAPRFGIDGPYCDIGAFEAPISTEAPAATLLFLHGQPGNLILMSGDRLLHPADGVFRADHDFGHVQVSFGGAASSWILDFTAPSGGDLTPGDYADATGNPFSYSSQPGLNVGGEGYGCSSITGRFSVREAEYAVDGSVDNFAADFEQHCDGRAAALFGSVRVRSNIPTASPAIGPTRTATSTPTPTPRLCRGDCNSDGAVTVGELIRGMAVSLGTTPVVDCASFDIDDNGTTTVDELVVAIIGALDGCRPQA